MGVVKLDEIDVNPTYSRMYLHTSGRYVILVGGEKERTWSGGMQDRKSIDMTMCALIEVRHGRSGEKRLKENDIVKTMLSNDGCCVQLAFAPSPLSSSERQFESFLIVKGSLYKNEGGASARQVGVFTLPSSSPPFLPSIEYGGEGKQEWREKVFNIKNPVLSTCCFSSARKIVTTEMVWKRRNTYRACVYEKEGKGEKGEKWTCTHNEEWSRDKERWKKHVRLHSSPLPPSALEVNMEGGSLKLKLDNGKLALFSCTGGGGRDDSDGRGRGGVVAKRHQEEERGEDVIEERVEKRRKLRIFEGESGASVQWGKEGKNKEECTVETKEEEKWEEEECKLEAKDEEEEEQEEKSDDEVVVVREVQEQKKERKRKISNSGTNVASSSVQRKNKSNARTTSRAIRTPSASLRDEGSDILVDGRKLEIVRELGSGGFGTVYLAEWEDREDKDIHEEVAAKMLDFGLEKSSHGAHRARVKSFKKEIAAYEKLDQSNNHIARLLGYETGDHYIILTEFCEGGSLEERLHGAHGYYHLSVQDRLNFAMQILEAISYLHGQKIIHRDLKPHNILLKEGAIKIIDFGLAVQSKHTNISSYATVTHATAGTWRYKAPEQTLSDDAGISGKVDIFSFGLVLYELMSYKRAWHDKKPDEVMLTFLETRQKFGNMKEREERRDLPAFPFSEADFEHGDVKQEWIRKELARIVSSCTDFDPTKRPHALTLLNQVEKLLNAFHLCLEKLEKLDSLCSDVLYESSTRKTGEIPGRVTADNFNFERPYVFLSYKTEQYEMVRRVAVILRQRCNVQVWLDRERLVAGESWASQIGLGLRKATCILGFWSNMWMRSTNCRAEWNTFVYRVNSPEDTVSRQDCFACIAGEWDYQLDDEMRVLSWGGTIQYRDLAALDGQEWERAVINLGTAIRARFDHPED